MQLSSSLEQRGDRVPRTRHAPLQLVEALDAGPRGAPREDLLLDGFQLDLEPVDDRRPAPRLKLVRGRYSSQPQSTLHFVVSPTVDGIAPALYRS